jgi:hypothetical protein
VEVLLCRDCEVSFLSVQHYSLDPNSYYLALCVYQRFEAGEEGEVRVRVLLCIG